MRVSCIILNITAKYAHKISNIHVNMNNINRKICHSAFS